MNVRVIIPVGPNHFPASLAAQATVVQAWRSHKGPFSRMQVVRVLDGTGTLGRSAARNKGMDQNPADWHFLLDADDTMMPEAFTLVDLDVAATFGAVCLDGKVARENVWPVDRELLLRVGAVGTLSMGCFVRGDLGLRFDEASDVGEDFDFYCRLPSFTKRPVPLVNIGYQSPSAGGPRSSANCDWVAACDKVVARYR